MRTNSTRFPFCAPPAVRTCPSGQGPAEAESGRHTYRLDLSGLTSGVYVLRLTAGGQTRTQKITVVQ